MDRKYHTNESKKFTGRGKAYIHTEVNENGRPETVLCGDMITMIWGIVAELSRISELTKTSFSDTVSMVVSIKKLGYKQVANLLFGKEHEYEIIEGEDWKEKLENEHLEKIKRQADATNVILTNEINEIRRENESLKKQISEIKTNNEKALSERETKIKKLSKELLSLEHRYDKLCEQLQFGDK